MTSIYYIRSTNLSIAVVREECDGQSSLCRDDNSRKAELPNELSLNISYYNEIEAPID